MKYRLIIKATGWTLDGVRAHVKDKLQLPKGHPMTVTRRLGTDSPMVVVDLDTAQVKAAYDWYGIPVVVIDGKPFPTGTFPVGTLLFFNEVIDNPNPKENDVQE